MADSLTPTQLVRKLEGQLETTRSGRAKAQAEAAGMAAMDVGIAIGVGAMIGTADAALDDIEGVDPAIAAGGVIALYGMTRPSPRAKVASASALGIVGYKIGRSLLSD